MLEFGSQWLVIMPKHQRLDCLDLEYPILVYLLSEQLLEGVAFMHANGVAHLDLKPSNIVVDMEKGRFGDNRELFIIDFGLAETKVDANSRVEGVRGTRGWRAPEIQENQKWSPILADRWACGKLLLHIGKDVKWNSTVLDLQRSLMDDDPQARPTPESVLEKMVRGPRPTVAKPGE